MNKGNMDEMTQENEEKMILEDGEEMIKSKKEKMSEEDLYLVDQAWSSIKRRFPRSSLDKDSRAGFASIVLQPILDINLTVELYFSKSTAKNQPPDIFVKSNVSEDDFQLRELPKTLELVCKSIKDWRSLGMEVEKIMQCVSVKRKAKNKQRSSELLLSNKSRLKGTDPLEKDRLQDNFEIEFDCRRVKSFLKKDDKTLRPNYFVAVRITNLNLIENLTKLQANLVLREELLTKGVIPRESLHLTLCNLGLDSADDLLRAIETLNQAKHQLHLTLPKSPFIVYGVSQFYNRAIFAKVKVDDQFLMFINVLREILEQAGIEFREDHEGFTPHVTVIKVRRPERKAFGTRNIQPSIYTDFIESVHGEQKVDAIHLCAMGGGKREDGFYVNASHLDFSANVNS